MSRASGDTFATQSAALAPVEDVDKLRPMRSSVRHGRALLVALALGAGPVLGTASSPAAAQPAESFDTIRKFVDHADYDEAERALAPTVEKEDRAKLLMSEVQLRTGK